MTYPGNPELSAQAQERVMSAFRQVVGKIQDGLSNEALIGLEFVLRLDPTFAPGVALQEQLISGQSDIDLSRIISQIGTPDTDAVNLLLIEAVEEFNQHRYLEAREKVEKVLIDLPGHTEARNLCAQIDDALKVETQVGQFLAQAKEALADNRPQDAANFVLMAQTLDPHHSGIEATLTEIHNANGTTQGVSSLGASPLQQPPEPPSIPVPGTPPEQSQGTLSEGGDFSTALVEEPAAASWDVAGAFEEPSSAPSVPPEPQPEAEGFDFGGDVADLFDASSDESGTPLWEAPDPKNTEQDDTSNQVAELITKGTSALDGGDPQEALHLLSKILLLDPDNLEAEGLIDRARTAIDTQEQQLQSSLSEAESAWSTGDSARARTLVEEVLFVSPNNEDALTLKARFNTESVEPSAFPPQEDSFPPEEGDDLPLKTPAADTAGFDDFDSAIDSLDSGSSFASPSSPPARRPARQIPWRWIILGAGALIVILIGMWMGSKFLPQGDEDIDTAQAVSERIQSAKTLFDQGKGEEALDLLKSFEAEGIDKQRIDKHIARIEAALTPPTPTPIPESVEQAHSLMDEGQWLDAYMVVDQGLVHHPGDPGLLELKNQILSIESDVSVLFGTLANKDFQAGVSLAEELTTRYPDQAGFGLVLDRCLFNAALTHLRAYNPTIARGLLVRLQERHPDDRDVARILDFISSYTNRPVDMQLEIFVGSLDFR